MAPSVSSPSFLSRSWLLIPLGVGLLALLLVYFWWVTDASPVASPEVPASAPSSPPSGVGALGRLEPGWKIRSLSPASSAEGSRVEQLFVEEGDIVQAGTVLAILDTHARRKASLAEAEAQVAVAQSRLALTRAGTKPEEIAAQEALVLKHRALTEQAELAFQRSRRLMAGRTISNEEFEQRKFEFTSQSALLNQAEKTLAALKVVRAEDIAVMEAELTKAKAGVTHALAELESSRIVAPIDGRILKISTRAGERIQESGVLEIGDTSNMHAVAEVYESDVPRIRVGQPATVRIQSLPGVLNGNVVHVGWRVGRRVVLDNDPVKDTDARVVEMRIKLDSASSARVAGLSYARVEVSIDAPPLTAPTNDNSDRGE